MLTTARSLKATAAAVLAVAALTACGGGAGPTGRTGADVAADNGTTATAPASSAPSTQPSSAPTSNPGPADDEVFQTVKLIAESGVANAGLLDPALDSRDEVLAPARVLLTADALARYTASVDKAAGKPEDTDLADGSAWQLVAHTACQPDQGDLSCTTESPVVGDQLRVEEISRIERTDGGFDVEFTAEIDLEFVRLADQATGTSPFVREYVVTLQRSDRPDGPRYLVDSWTGTETKTAETVFTGGE